MVLNGTLCNLWVAGSPFEVLCSGNNGVLLLQAVNIHPSIVEERHPGNHKAHGFQENLRLEDLSGSLALERNIEISGPYFSEPFFPFSLSKLLNFIPVSCSTRSLK